MSNNENIMWQPITQISRHPSNGNLLKFTTESGRTVITTKSHSLLKKSLKPNSVIPEICPKICQ